MKRNFFRLPLICVCGIGVQAASVVNVALSSGVKLHVVELPFMASGLKIEGCTGKAQHCRIDGRPYGMAAGLPKTYIRSITLIYGKSNYNLDSSEMYDAQVAAHLRQNGDHRYFGGYCTDDKNCIVRCVLADGADTFAAEWVIADGVATRTVFSGDTDIIGLFLKYIDPPRYE